MSTASTTTLRRQVVAPKYYFLDAKGLVLGRVATRVSRLLQGKEEPDFTPHLGGKDVVIVVNASEIKVTGHKLEQKTYYRHSGYPGGFRQESLADKMSKKPLSILNEAVYGMLPKNKLRSKAAKRLKVFLAEGHPFTDKKLEVITLK